MRWVELDGGRRWVRSDRVVGVRVADGVVALNTDPPEFGGWLRFSPRGLSVEEQLRCAEFLVDELTNHGDCALTICAEDAGLPIPDRQS